MSYDHPEGSAADGPLRVRARLEDVGSSIAAASGWQTLTDGEIQLTGSFVSEGGTTIEVTLSGSVVVALLGGGGVRVVVNGGSFLDEEATVEPTALGAGTHRIAQHGFVDLPAGPATTYTVTAQGRATVALSSITPGTNTNLIALEYPQ